MHAGLGLRGGDDWGAEEFPDLPSPPLADWAGELQSWPQAELFDAFNTVEAADEGLVIEGMRQGERDKGVEGDHLNPLGLFLRTSLPFIWRILSAFLPA